MTENFICLLFSDDVVLIVVFHSRQLRTGYAWQMKESQSDPEKLVSSCLEGEGEVKGRVRRKQILYSRHKLNH